ncbi:MAG: T9SS type A sorting domain-containing protein, partial [Crocinitomicaceae bacterium]|nr:T9SS type A sorting domain-containing protein [Crocinitomicaceae bacterium]
LQNGGSNTFMAWVYPKAPSGIGDDPIMFKDEQFFLGMDAATNIPKFKAYIGGAWHTLDGNSALDTNEWNHLIGMVTGSQMKLFVDGELISENNVSGSTNFSMYPLYIGANIGTGNYYKGRIDELSIWSSAYDNESIKEHRWENGSADNLLYQRAYFKFNKGIGLENNTVNPGAFEPFLSGTLTDMDTNTCWKQNYASVWEGTEDSDYSNEKNWQDGMVPDLIGSGTLEAVKYVIVPKHESGSNLVIDETIDVNNIIFNLNSNVTLKPGGDIRIQENLYSYGAPNFEGGVGFNGNSTQYIYGENDFHDLNIDANVILEDDQNVSGELTLNTGSLNVNGKSLTILSDSTNTGEIYHNSGSIIGEVTMQRYLDYDSTSFGWHYLSSPMNGATFLELDDDVPLVGLGNLPTDNPWPNVMTYDESNTDTNEQIGWGGPANADVEIEQMQGFVLALFWIDLTIDFTGTVNDGPISRWLTHTESGNPDADGWNFIGNPYPSMIDWSLVEIPDDMYSAVYLYDSENDRYLDYVGGYGINGLTNRIASMQGFYVRVKNSVESVLFELTNDARTSGDNDAHFKGNNEEDFALKLRVIGEDLSDELIVRLLDSASVKFDPKCDAYKLFGIENKLSIYTRIGMDKISINTMPYPNANKVIPITMETNGSGDYTFLVPTKDDLDSSIQVYLEDTKFDLLHDITTGEPYTFNFEKGVDENRFNIRFKIDGDDTDVEVEFEAYYYDQNIYVLGLEEETNFSLYSISGELVLSDILMPSPEQVIDLDQLKPGCYIMHIFGGEQQIIKRLLKEPKVW